jgi:Lon protease-like protein
MASAIAELQFAPQIATCRARPSAVDAGVEAMANAPRAIWTWSSRMESRDSLPLIPMRDVVVFPYMMMPFIIGRPSSARALEDALRNDKRVFLAAQHDAAVADPRPEDLHEMGCVAHVVQSLKLPDGDIKVLVEGVDRARAVGWKGDKDFYRVVVKVLPKQKEKDVNAEATMSRVVSLFEQYVKLSNNLHYDAMIAAVRVDDPNKLADTIAAHLLVAVDEKQKLLEMTSPMERLVRLEGLLAAEVAMLRARPAMLRARPPGQTVRRWRFLEFLGFIEHSSRLQVAALSAGATNTASESRAAMTEEYSMRELLGRHETVLEFADAIVQGFVNMLDDVDDLGPADDRELKSRVQTTLVAITTLRTEVAAAWTRFGVERRKMNQGPPAVTGERRRSRSN